MDITVIIPTFNRASLLKRAINSVLAQKFSDFKLIISDNCSIDDTPEVLEDYRSIPNILINRNVENLGMVGNWRKCIEELCTTPWFILMSDDDYLIDENYLAEVAQSIRDYNPKLVFAGGIISLEKSDTRLEFRPHASGLLDGMTVFAQRGTQHPQDMILCNVAFRRDDAIRLRFLENPDELCCDSRLFLSLCVEGPVYCISKPVCVYTLHGGNLIEKARSVTRYLVSYFDHLIVPYKIARDAGAKREVLAAFEKNTRMKSILKKTLWRLMINDKKSYNFALRRLLDIDRDYLNSNYLNVGTRLQTSIIRALGPILVKHFPVED